MTEKQSISTYLITINANKGKDYHGENYKRALRAWWTKEYLKECLIFQNGNPMYDREEEWEKIDQLKMIKNVIETGEKCKHVHMHFACSFVHSTHIKFDVNKLQDQFTKLLGLPKDQKVYRDVRFIKDNLGAALLYLEKDQ